MQLKSLGELTRRDCWPRLRARLGLGTMLEGEILPADSQSCAATLLALQLSTASPLGALAYHCGGLLLDSGWLRILGSGHARLPWGLAEWNGLQSSPSRLLIAHDVVGGFFARESNKHISYLSPDTRSWEQTGLKYPDWLAWALGDLRSHFYEDLRWPGWAQEVETLGSHQGLGFEPPLFQSGAPLRQRRRRKVSMQDLWHSHQPV